MRILRDKRQESLLVKLEDFSRAEGEPGAIPMAHLRSMLSLARSNIAALSRDTYEPGHFTASGFVLSPDENQLLLIFHKKLGMWLQPGGHVESTDADLLSAARREILEETGVAALALRAFVFDVDVHEIPPHRDAPAHLHYDVRSLFLAQSLELEASEEVADVRWFDLGDIVATGADLAGAGAGDLAGTGAHQAGTGADLAGGYSTDESVRRVARRLLRA